MAISEGEVPHRAETDPPPTVPNGANTLVPALRSADFPVVGIGASAGGLQAFEALFSGMPTNTDPGMAFVLVQHLAPGHESLLVSLLQRRTRLEVLRIVDGVRVRPNILYVIPPGCGLSLLGGCLQLKPQPPETRYSQLVVDDFFKSLADELGERAIGVVLSGTGHDGTAGLKAIKARGGLAMVQTPESAEFDGMPRSAIEAGVADYTLEPAQMLPQLIAYAQHAVQAEVGVVGDDRSGAVGLDRGLAVRAGR
jgi:two-component system CheB/CheR fusion protein